MTAPDKPLSSSSEWVTVESHKECAEACAALAAENSSLRASVGHLNHSLELLGKLEGARARALGAQLSEEVAARTAAEARVKECQGNPFAGDPGKWPHVDQIAGLGAQLIAAQARVKELEGALRWIRSTDRQPPIGERILVRTVFFDRRHPGRELYEFHVGALDEEEDDFVTDDGTFVGLSADCIDYWMPVSDPVATPTPEPQELPDRCPACNHGIGRAAFCTIQFGPAGPCLCDHRRWKHAEPAAEPQEGE